MAFQALKLQTVLKANQRVIAQTLFNWYSRSLAMCCTLFTALCAQEGHMDSRDHLCQLIR